MADWVECHSGYVYADRPVALHWEGNRMASYSSCITMSRWMSGASANPEDGKDSAAG
jgi:hypothetical protein